MKYTNSTFTKRVLLAVLLGTLAGCFCFWGFSQNSATGEMAKYADWSWTNVMMWMIIINRLTIGFVIGIAGFVTHHPVFGFRLHPIIRGAKIGILISLTLSLGALMNPDPEVAKQGFWMITIAGGVIGIIIDLIVTKFAGEGKNLLPENTSQ